MASEGGFPYAGIIRVRYNGYDLSRIDVAPLQHVHNKQLRTADNPEVIVQKDVHMKFDAVDHFLRRHYPDQVLRV